MGDVFETFVWPVRSYECAPDGCATVANICNYLQESASLNAAHLGFSKLDFDADGLNRTWVLARLKVEISRRPKWGERVHVLTFPRLGRRIVAYRDFAVTDDAGAGLVRATSEWMMIDLSTRRPVPIPESVFAKANTQRPPVLGESAFTARLRWPADARSGSVRRVAAAPSDIDLNGHVNNVRYVTWLFDARGGDQSCSSLELVFRRETTCGEEVVCESTTTADGRLLQRLRSPAGEERVLALVAT
ncbi:MAG: acyl-[acyl-carrier-protein] thioesterase [Kiritimatiellia bacterium]